MKCTCLIVDDEPLAINVIKKHLLQFRDFELAGSCECAVEAFNLLKEQEIQLLFLDINMPGLNGIDFIKSLEHPPAIVLTTAYREYAVEGYELDVLDYLVKPIGFARFMKTIDKANSYLKLQKQALQAIPPSGSIPTEAEDFLFTKVDKKMVKVYFADILYIESLKDYIRIKTVYEDLITHHNLSGFTKLLPADRFMRIHRSYTVSLEKIKSLEGSYLHLEKKSLPIGRIFQKEVKDVILNRSTDLF